MSINVIMLAMRLLRNKDRIAGIKDMLEGMQAEEPAPLPEIEFPVGSVEWLQHSLNALENSQLEVDGDYGEMTRDAVEDYQTEHGLKVDGWAGPETVNSIIAELETLNATG